MWANAVIRFLVRVLDIPVGRILAPITTLVGGVLLHVPLVNILLMLVGSLVWVPFVALLMLSARLWHGFPLARPVAALIGVPAAIIGDTLNTLFPGGPVAEDHFSKAFKRGICQNWPFTDGSLFKVKPDGTRLVGRIAPRVGFFDAVNYVVTLVTAAQVSNSVPLMSHPLLQPYAQRLKDQLVASRLTDPTMADLLSELEVVTSPQVKAGE